MKGVEVAQQPGEEEDSQTQHHVPGVKEGIQSVASVGPVADGGGEGSHEVFLGNNEVAAVEERRYGGSQQERSHEAVQHQEGLVGTYPKEVAQPFLKLITHGLQHEGEEDGHPQPVGTPEAGTVEEGEGGEEGASEGDEGGKGDFPPAARTIYQLTSLLFRTSYLEEL